MERKEKKSDVGNEKIFKKELVLIPYCVAFTTFGY